MKIKGLKRKDIKRLSNQCKECQYFGEGCFYLDNDYKCVRFLSKYKTNLTRVNMIFETNYDVDTEIFSQKLSNWVEYNGWACCGSISPYDDKEN